MEDSCDLMLRYCWIIKHKAKWLGDGRIISFESEEWRKTCSRHNGNSLTFEIDDTILNLGSNLQWIGIIENLKINGKDEIEIDCIGIIPWQYQDYKSPYIWEVTNVLPPLQSLYNAIDIQTAMEPSWGLIYALSEKQLSVLKEYIKEMINQGKIRPSKWPADAPILFIPKLHGRGLWLCVDYPGLNKLTMVIRRLLPLMNTLWKRIQGAKVFAKINLKAGFHLIQVRDGDQWKTAFRTRPGLYEYAMMRFCLVNAPATFQDAMEMIFTDMLDWGLVIHMDDFLIYIETEEEHIQIVLVVLRQLKENNLSIAPDKCISHTSKVEFLGRMLSLEGIESALDRSETILEWPNSNANKMYRCSWDSQRFIEDSWRNLQ